MEEEDVYFCKKCNWFGTKKEMDGINCPECGEHRHIYDYGDYGDYDNQVMGGGDFNWNKK